MLITVEQYILHAATNMYKNKKKNYYTLEECKGALHITATLLHI